MKYRSFRSIITQPYCFSIVFMLGILLIFSSLHANSNFNHPGNNSPGPNDSLNNLPLIAYYPMQGNLRDSLGLNKDLSTFNIEVRDTGIWSVGTEAFTDSTSQIFTPNMSGLNLNNFHFSLEVWLDSINNAEASLNRAIAFGGSSFRWARIRYHPTNKTFNLGYNNSARSPNHFDFEYRKWYRLGVSYNRKEREIALWIDGVKVDSQSVNLQHISDRNIVLNCSCGPALMRGLWRNLRVYSKKESLEGPISSTCIIDQMPSTDMALDGAFTIFVKGDTGPYDYLITGTGDTIKNRSHSPEINITDLSVGNYSITVNNWRDTVHCSVTLPNLPTELPLLSYYPLQTNFSDVENVHEPLSNPGISLVAFTGIQIPGHAKSDSIFSQTSTVLEKLDFKNFHISLDVKIDSIFGQPGSDQRTLFIGGLDTKWLVPMYSQSQKQFFLTYNQFMNTPGTFSFQYNQWYEVGLSYNNQDNVVRLYVNREVVALDTLALITENDHSIGVNCNCDRDPMKGLWRNLRVYSIPDTVTTPIRMVNKGKDFLVYPNPFMDKLQIRFAQPLAQSSPVVMTDMLGRIVWTHKVPQGTVDYSINGINISKGIYALKWGSESSWLIKH